MSETKKICLNMIVKNEADVIKRVLASVKNFITYYVIVDTGSTDGTPKIIEDTMAEYSIPGEVHSRLWVNFGYNRQQALELALAPNRADWILFIDADEEFDCISPYWHHQLQEGITYELEKHHGDLRYSLPNLIWVRDTVWSWHGVVHEYIKCAQLHPRVKIYDAWIIYHSGEGCRSKGITEQEKFLRDAKLLKEDLKKHPNDERSCFYLAQSYRDAGKFDNAFKAYTKRSQMIGWDQETFCAYYERAELAINLKKPHSEIIKYFLEAWAFRPTRAEPMWRLAAYCREKNIFNEAYLFSNTAKDIPMTEDTLFINRSVYEWRAWDEFAVSSYWFSKYKESVAACEHLLSLKTLPNDNRERIETNLRCGLAKLNNDI